MRRQVRRRSRARKAMMPASTAMGKAWENSPKPLWRARLVTAV
jgi:hypothetical protein